MEITKALKNRHIGGHDLNSRSNRSHCITEIYIDLPGNQSRIDDGNTADWVSSINAPLNADYDPVSQQHEYSRVILTYLLTHSFTHSLTHRLWDA